MSMPSPLLIFFRTSQNSMEQVWSLGFIPGSVHASSLVFILCSVQCCHVVLEDLFPLCSWFFWTWVLGIPSGSAVFVHWVCSGPSSLVLFGIRRRLEVASTGGEQSNNWENKWDQYLILCSQPTFSKPHLYWFLWVTLPFLGESVPLLSRGTSKQYLFPPW